MSQGNHPGVNVDPVPVSLLNVNRRDNPAITVPAMLLKSNFATANQLDKAMPGDIAPMLIMFRAVDRIQSNSKFTPEPGSDDCVTINHTPNLRQATSFIRIADRNSLIGYQISCTHDYFDQGCDG